MERKVLEVGYLVKILEYDVVNDKINKSSRTFSVLEKAPEDNHYYVGGINDDGLTYKIPTPFHSENLERI